MNYRKVTGERVGAAIIDNIIISLITGILGAIYIFSTWDIEALTEVVMESNGMLDPELLMTLAEDLLVVTTLLGLVFGVIYFVLIPWKWNGQTLGKKILSIKAINEQGENPTLWQHFLRSVQVWSNYVITVLMIFILVDYQVFYVLSSAIGNLVSIAVFVSFILMLVQQDGRGLHDMLAKTYVVKVNAEQVYYQPQPEKTSDWIEEPQEKEEDDWGF